MRSIKLIFFTSFLCILYPSYGKEKNSSDADRASPTTGRSIFDSLGEVAKKVVGKEKGKVQPQLNALSPLEKQIVDVHSFWEPIFHKDIDHAKVDSLAAHLDNSDGGSVGGGAMFKEAMNNHFLAKTNIKQAVDAEENAKKFDKKAVAAAKTIAAKKFQQAADQYRKDGHIHIQAMHEYLIKFDDIKEKHDRIHGHGHAFPDANECYK